MLAAAIPTILFWFFSCLAIVLVVVWHERVLR